MGVTAGQRECRLASHDHHQCARKEYGNYLHPVYGDCVLLQEALHEAEAMKLCTRCD